VGFELGLQIVLFPRRGVPDAHRPVVTPADDVLAMEDETKVTKKLLI
jgi:hypothetical protein